jgi:hypothetical protein
LNSLDIDESNGEFIIFNDMYKLSWSHGCSCPFFLQYAAPCVHSIVYFNGLTPEIFLQAWRIVETPVAEPAILQGPLHDPNMSSNQNRADLMALSTDLQTRLLGMAENLALLFVKKFHDMLDRGDLNALPEIRNPPAVQSRGRPRNTKRKRNAFRGGRDIA